ncbi:thiopeptide-type bacteriocin biosynthesis protein [Adhaeribacter rhizoryzae]|uniref:Thiopeptide-type bacteriocin biosynthesis domain-containing protein n=1 Tax=Adhaeribacter rhizoryzae TaxID=2607907 RepID=A0A5M6D6W3_9BACT|nr:thiopeptide-type bacteriocin biosynthesis protein [Adhaeribacter rhizoryzae]KAA5541579.1 hypothetical protein F0145_20405 [Adhaeribacter rhizoryzae]
MKSNLHPQSGWLSAHLFYNEPWEEFLKKGVMPFVQQILTNRQAEQFFFIRYWEKGPHIRLRFKGNPEVLENQVKPKLVPYFSDYFQANPSQRTDPARLSEIPAAYQWYPNNSIQFIPYEPETERYGGEAGILIAERQFQASSEAVLAVLQEKNNWDYDQALGTAIQLHLGFAFAAGMDFAETVSFFASIFRNWLPRACFSYPQQLTPAKIKVRQETVLKAFRNTYQKQKAFLLPLFTQLWQALENQNEFEQAWFNKWLSQMRAVNAALRQAQATGQLHTPAGYANLFPETALQEPQQRWAIYDSYIHMTNNRLGILNRDEGYLGYLIKEGLTEMALQTA